MRPEPRPGLTRRTLDRAWARYLSRHLALATALELIAGAGRLVAAALRHPWWTLTLLGVAWLTWVFTHLGPGTFATWTLAVAAAAVTIELYHPDAADRARQRARAARLRAVYRRDWADDIHALDLDPQGYLPTLLGVQPTDRGETARVRLARGQTAAAWDAKTANLATTWNARAVRVRRVPGEPQLIQLHVYRHSPGPDEVDQAGPFPRRPN